jgi:hypothetical protein
VDGDYGVYKKGSVWAEPDIDEAADYMRRVFGNRTEAETVGARGGEFIKKYYSQEAISDKYKGRLNKIMIDCEDNTLKQKKIEDELRKISLEALAIHDKLIYAIENAKKNK